MHIIPGRGRDERSGAAGGHAAAVQGDGPPRGRGRVPRGGAAAGHGERGHRSQLETVAFKFAGSENDFNSAGCTRAFSGGLSKIFFGAFKTVPRS